MLTDKSYQEWLRGKPCIICSQPSEPCHVRLNGRGGMGVKPRYSSVPMCRYHHNVQHQKGHTALMSKEDWLYYAGENLRQFLLDMT